MELSSHDRHDLVMIMLMQSSGRLATQLANKAKLKFINQSFMKGYILINMIYLLCSTVLLDPYLLFVSIKVFHLSRRQGSSNPNQDNKGNDEVEKAVSMHTIPVHLQV